MTVFPEPSQEVVRLWDAVFKVSDGVIKHAKEFGFPGMSRLDPNIHDIMLWIGLVEGGIDALSTDPDAPYEDVRLLLNSKRQMSTLKYVASALNRGDLEDFEKAMLDLENQATF